MAMQNLNLEGLKHWRSQKQRRTIVLGAYLGYLGTLIITTVSVFGGHLLTPATRTTPHIIVHFVLEFTWPILALLSIFSNYFLSRALPEYMTNQAALDERQLRVRDSAYRRSYFVIQFAILALFAFKLITLVTGVHIVQPSINLFEFTPFMVSISGLINLVPISIIAWNERD